MLPRWQAVRREQSLERAGCRRSRYQGAISGTKTKPVNNFLAVLSCQMIAWSTQAPSAAIG
jgi:hypothetical protein